MVSIISALLKSAIEERSRYDRLILLSRTDWRVFVLFLNITLALH
jgi:hypothetical protein